MFGDHMEWFAIRSLYLFGIDEFGNNVFEERIVSICAKDFTQAHIKGRLEAEEYASNNKFEMHSEQLVYKQDGKQLIDGYELWSVLYQSKLTLNNFYKSHYLKYVYTP
jgi:hypothetical protein